jgi:short-subunit dehydrogenase
MAAFVHNPLQASYTASKAGVWAMCNSIRLEVRHLGVDVGSIHPTFFGTPLMDDVIADPAGQELWRGNKRGIWRMVPIEVVIDDTVRAIERRSKTVIVPRANTPVAVAAGLFRPLVERIGWPGGRIPRAVAVASSTGWHDPTAISRHEPPRAATAAPLTDLDDPRR